MGVSDGQDLGANLALHPGLSGEERREDKREQKGEDKREQKRGEERREGRKERSGDKRIKGDWRSGEDTYGNISIETAAFGCDN